MLSKSTKMASLKKGEQLGHLGILIFKIWIWVAQVLASDSLVMSKFSFFPTYLWEVTSWRLLTVITAVWLFTPVSLVSYWPHSALWMGCISAVSGRLNHLTVTRYFGLGICVSAVNLCTVLDVLKTNPLSAPITKQSVFKALHWLTGTTPARRVSVLLRSVGTCFLVPTVDPGWACHEWSTAHTLFLCREHPLTALTGSFACLFLLGEDEQIEKGGGGGCRG